MTLIYGGAVQAAAAMPFLPSSTSTTPPINAPPFSCVKTPSLDIQTEHQQCCHAPPPPASAIRATDLRLDDDSDARPHEEIASRRAHCPAAPTAEDVRSVDGAAVYLNDDA